MKTVKHIFKQESLQFENDEIVSKDEEIELFFSLPLSALGLFEEEYGKPLVDIIIKNTNSSNQVGGEELDSIEFSRALACCMYIKIENGKVTNDESSKEEFKKMDIYKSVASDLQLRIELVSCAIQCLNDNNTKSAKSGKKSKK